MGQPHHGKHLQRPGREVLLQPDEDGNDPFSFFEQTDEQTVPDKALDNAETQRMILELVNALPDEQRMCIVLHIVNGGKSICFGWVSSSGVQLETTEGTYYTSMDAHTVYDPGQEDYVTLYFDNAKGIPKKITINELYELQTNGLPKGMNGSTVRIELTADK